jgi:uncharacterized repeat protein (TIGR03803 family)
MVKSSHLLEVFMSLFRTLRTCLILFIAVTAAISSTAQTFTTLHTFTLTDGAFPYGALVQGLDGDLYGTTSAGARNICYGGCGTVFKITSSGTLTTLHEFIGTDGISPRGLVLAGDGNFYGTTNENFYEITPEGTFISIVGIPPSTGNPPSINPPLMQDTIDGNFYGTTPLGGTHTSGTVFRITPSGVLTTLRSFCNFKNCADGGLPTAPLVQSNGFLYGTTRYGGSPGPNGTFFKIGTAGALNVLYDFEFTDNFGNAISGLIVGNDGNFYGTTEQGGIALCPGGFGCGTIFKITPEGTFTTLHAFDITDGANPVTALIQATDGNFYGTTSGTGSRGTCSGNNCGSVFQLTPDGTLTTLHSFDKTDGMDPAAALVQGTDGNIYGTTNGFIGQHLYGTVFQLSMGLAPFVKTVPAGGYTHTQVLILGTNLTGATSVTFNGKTAVFTVVSPTEIQATVPGNATTGTVEVVTPGGTLLSNVPFQVL